MKIFVLNAGSSGWKCSLFDFAENQQAPASLWRGSIEWEDGEQGTLQATGPSGTTDTRSLERSSKSSAVDTLLDALCEGPARAVAELAQIDMVGHRVVHGGDRFPEPVIVDEDVVRAIGELAEFAPVHNPVALEGISAIGRRLAGTPQFAVFDTSFHRDLPAPAAQYAIPLEWTRAGVRRYGFHGISLSGCVPRAAELMERETHSLRLIVAHLGNGASATAVSGGRSAETTMGFTPLEGLMMGTRSGSLDPAAVLYLLRRNDGGLTPAELERRLNAQSGLLGVSGVAGDMRAVSAAARGGNERAQLAIDMFVHRVSAAVGALRSSLDSLDGLIFTGGIGEHDADIRSQVCARLRYLGIELDPQANANTHGERDITGAGSSVRVLVITAQEDLTIAQAGPALLATAR